MADQAPAVIELVRHREWGAATAATQRIGIAWTTVASNRRHRVSRALHRLEAAIRRRDVHGASRAAIELQQGTLDLEVGYRPVVEVDTERFRVWVSRLELDAAAGDLVAVRRDVPTLSRLLDRIGHAVPDDRMARADQELAVLQEAVADGELGRVGRASERLAEGW